MASLLIAIVAVLGTTACAGDDGDDGSAAKEETAATSGDAGAMNDSTVAEDSEMAAEGSGAPAVESPAGDLRLTLGRLLGEHALLATFATQKGFAGDKDFMAIGAALDRNSVDLSEAIGSVYGDAAAKKFLDGTLLWRDHIGFFVDYTVGLAKKDKAMQRKAVGNLKGYNEAFASFLSGATELPQDALRMSIGEHIAQLKGQIDAYSRGNYNRAYEELRAAYAHMLQTGDTLAGGITEQAPDKFPAGEATAPAVELRATLGRLLGEHAVLAMLATQKGFSGDPDFKSIAAVLDRNSVELSEAIGSVYGDAAAKKFLDGKLLWRDHIGFFVDYTVGLARKDKAMQRKAVGNLKGYIEAFSAFLSQATGLPQDALRKSIGEHVMQLKGQIDAYSKGDYAQAYRLAREAYAHMYETGDTLAGGIVAQSPDKFASS
jgi:hypothetical protein